MILRMLIMLMLACAPGAALAQTAPAPLDTVDLAAQRGGIQTPLGLEIGFGATVRSYVDGQLALESKLTWADTGAMVEQSNLGPIQGVVIRTGAIGVSDSVSSGDTLIAHDLSASRIASVVINSASNRSIRQDTDIVLTLPQLPQLQQQMAQDRVVSQLQASLGAALSSKAGR